MLTDLSQQTKYRTKRSQSWDKMYTDKRWKETIIICHQRGGGKDIDWSVGPHIFTISETHLGFYGSNLSMKNKLLKLSGATLSVDCGRSEYVIKFPVELLDMASLIVGACRSRKNINPEHSLSSKSQS